MNLIEINAKFPTELEAVKYFEKIRYGKTVKCPYCKSPNVSSFYSDYRRNCKNCGKGFSVTIGTKLQSTHIPLKTWLYAFAIISNAKKGISAKQLERDLGVHYETAWNMYHKIRELMIVENKEVELDGIVEMDETFIGGKPRKFNTGDTVLPLKRTSIPHLDEKLKDLKKAGIRLKRGRGNPAKSDIAPLRGRGSKKKIPVVGMLSREGMVIAEIMRTLSYENLKDMVKKYVDEDESILITDEYPSYNKMNKIIEHIKIDHNKLYSYKGINTNSIESFWAIIKRQIIGQHHHVSAKHLPKYIAETVFKYNNRKDDDMFETLVKNSLLPL